MAAVNVYKQYFSASCISGGVMRKAALVMLISDSGSGQVKYEAAVSFFPHRDESDFSVTYDAYFSRELYSGRGRRSKKRESALLAGLKDEIDGLSAEADGKVFWDQPLGGARLA